MSLIKRLHLKSTRVAFAASIVTLAAVGGLSYHSARGLIGVQDQINDVEQVIDLLDDLVAEAALAESANRAYIVTGDSRYAEDFQTAAARVRHSLASLHELTAGSSTDRGNVARLESVVSQKLANESGRIEARRTAGSDAGLKSLAGAAGFVGMDRIRSLTDAIKAEKRSVLRERTALARREAEGSAWGLLAGSLISFTVLLAIFYRMTREILQRQRSEQRLAISNRLYGVLSEVNQAIVRVRDRGRIFQELCRIAVEHGLYRVAWIGMIDAGSSSLRREAAAGFPDGTPAWLNDALGTPLVRERVVCNDLAESDCRLPWRTAAQSQGFGSAAIFPILVEGSPAGVLVLCATDAGAFDQENLNLLQEIVADVGFALENLNRDALRRQAEAALRRQAQIIDQVHDSIISTDLSGYVTSWNQGAESLTGFRAEEAMGRHISFLYAKEDREFLEQQIIAPLKVRGSHEVVARMFRQSGEEFVAHLSVSFFRDERGEPIGMIGYSMDITESRRAEQALRESEERFRQMADNIHEVFWMADAESGRLLYVSPAYEEIWGRSCESAYLQSPSAALELLHPGDREAAAAARQALLAQQTHEYEYRLLRPDGSMRWILDRAFPIRDESGRVYRFAGIARDITERREATLALRIRVAQQRAIAELGQRAIENTELGALFNTTVERAADVLNVECCKVLELLPDGEELLLRAGVGWKNGSIGATRVPTDRDSQAGFTLVSKGPVVVKDFRSENRFQEPDLLREHNILSGVSVLIGDAQHPFGVLGAHSVIPREFTEDDARFLQAVASLLAATVRRTQAEEQIQKLNADLELRVEERTAELALLNRELDVRNQEVERANRLKSEFLATMSHEIRTPLNSVIGFTQLLTREKPGPLNSKQQRFLKNIDDAARHLLQLINDILDLSRIEAGRIELHRELFDIAESLGEVLSVVKPLAGLKQLELTADAPAGLVVHADRVRFKQMLYNLLSNAVKFTPEGGKVGVACTVHESGVRLDVSDTGVGIPVEEQKAIFDQFHQVGVTSRGVREGAGLGLAITKRLVELHQGTIRVESEPGRGSRFTIALPNTVPERRSRGQSATQGAAE